jgi:FixJ family two-component response regulator
MSGESFPHEVSDDPEPDAVAFLEKPFRTQQLMQAIDLAVQSFKA